MLALALFHEGDIERYRQIEAQRAARPHGEDAGRRKEGALDQELRRRIENRAGSGVIDDAEHVLMSLSGDPEGVSTGKRGNGEEEKSGLWNGEMGKLGKLEKGAGWSEMGKPEKRSQTGILLEKLGKPEKVGKKEDAEKSPNRSQTAQQMEKLENLEKLEKLEKPKSCEGTGSVMVRDDDFECFDVMSIYSLDEIARFRDREKEDAHRDGSDAAPSDPVSVQTRRTSVSDPSKRTITMSRRQELRSLFAKNAQGDSEYQSLLNSIAHVSGNTDGVARLPEVRYTPENLKNLREYLHTLNLSSEQIDNFLGEA